MGWLEPRGMGWFGELDGDAEFALVTDTTRGYRRARAAHAHAHAHAHAEASVLAPAPAPASPRRRSRPRPRSRSRPRQLAHVGAVPPTLAVRSTTTSSINSFADELDTQFFGSWIHSPMTYLLGIWLAGWLAGRCCRASDKRNSLVPGLRLRPRDQCREVSRCPPKRPCPTATRSGARTRAWARGSWPHV